MPTSRVKEEIARLLKEEGYIRDFRVEQGEAFNTLVIELKYGRSRERVITNLKRISKPGRRIYARKDRMPRVLGGMGTAILSTSSGVMTSRSPRSSAASAARSSVSSGSAHEPNRKITHRAARRRLRLDLARARDGQRPARRARRSDVPQRMHDRADGEHDHRHAARPTAARTARCTG